MRAEIKGDEKQLLDLEWSNIHTTSHGNTTQLDNYRKQFYSDGKVISNGTSLGL